MPLWLRSALVGMLVGVAVVVFFPRLFSSGSASAPALPALVPAMRASHADAVEAAAPAVVNIYTTRVVRRRGHPLLDDPMFQRFFGATPVPRARLESSLGSGVVLSASGHVLTNNHVIEGADEILVALQDGRSAPARLLGLDPDTDLALLAVELDGLSPIRVAPTGAERVGDVVLAIGNPFGVGQTVTRGIVSAIGRHRSGDTVVEDYIQTDAAINPGNSGGALVNVRGQLIGIVTAIYSQTGGYQGIGFAVPAAVALSVAKELETHGRVRRGWLGMEIQDLTPALAASLGTRQEPGVVVAGVYRGAPAQRAGVEPGDVLRAVGDTAVRNAAEVRAAESALRPGAFVTVTVERAGRVQRLNLAAGDRPR